MSTKQITPVLDTNSTPMEEKPITGVTYLSNLPDDLESIDNELHAIHMLVDDTANESQARPVILHKSLVAFGKQVARGTIAEYERNIDAMAKLPIYKKSHTRDQVENIFLSTRDGKIFAERAKLSKEYLEAHK